MGDLFHLSVDWAKPHKIINIIKKASWHKFLILTKRPYLMREYFLYGIPVKTIPNLWLGVSVENQRTADERIPILLQIPAAKRFVSVEPMLGQIDLTGFAAVIKDERRSAGNNLRRLDWVICGGETGPKARWMNPAWARNLRDDCKKAGVPFFFKKMSGKAPIPKDLMIREYPA